MDSGGGENIKVSTKRYVRSVADMGVLDHRGAGRCMYVHGKDECDILCQMIPMRIDMAIVQEGWKDTVYVCVGACYEDVAIIIDGYM